MYSCLCVTCHLHFWQNDRGLLRATAATRGGTDTEYESTYKVNYGEENSPVAPAGTRTRNLSIMSPALCQQAISNPSSNIHEITLWVVSEPEQPSRSDAETSNIQRTREGNQYLHFHHFFLC